MERNVGSLRFLYLSAYTKGHVQEQRLQSEVSVHVSQGSLRDYLDGQRTRKMPYWGRIFLNPSPMQKEMKPMVMKAS